MAILIQIESGCVTDVLRDDDEDETVIVVDYDTEGACDGDTHNDAMGSACFAYAVTPEMDEAGAIAYFRNLLHP